MENENKRPDELNEEIVEVTELETLEETETNEETVEEEIEETEESIESVQTEESLEETVIINEEEIAEMKAKKAKKIKLYAIIAAVLVVVVALVAFFVCYTEGTFGNTAVNNPVSSLSGDGEKTDDIRYENPLVTAFDTVLGKNKDAVMKIDGVPVDKDIFNFFLNSTAVNCVYSLAQMGMIKDISDFDWEDIETITGLSYTELSKGMAIDSIASIYACVAVGEKKGIVLTEEEELGVRDWLDVQKMNYGESFESVLKKSGYESEETLYKVQKLQVLSQKVYNDIMADINSYLTDDVKKVLSEDKITVKHILIEARSDEEKESAKKEAEMVLEKAKNGEEFEKLIEEYNDDPGMKNDPTGYTFAKDGTMVPEFEEASFKLNVGEISGIVETSYGYHIIKRVERVFTAEDYIKAIGKKAIVNIKKGVYDNMKVSIDLNNYFGEPEAETEEEETTKEN